jgi:hypothetical protein
MKTPLAIFILLQILDIATTLVVLAMGGRETNPIVQHFMTVGPVAGLVISKLTVTAIAAAIVALRRNRGLRLANVAFTGVVAWNFTIIARMAMLAS